jgi:hypothetical protein
LVRRASRVILGLKDAVLIALSAVLVATDIGPGKELANLILAAIAGLVLALAIISMALNVLRSGSRGACFWISAVHLAVGIFMVLLYPPYGAVLLVFSTVAVIALRQRKPAQTKGPPKPLTKGFRVLMAVAILLILSGMLLPMTSSYPFSLMGFYLRLAGIGQAQSLPPFTLEPSGVFLALATFGLAPVSAIIGLAAIFRTRLALWAGILSVAATACWILVLQLLSAESQIAAGLGVYVLGSGGIVSLIAYVKEERIQRIH